MYGFSTLLAFFNIELSSTRIQTAEKKNHMFCCVMAISFPFQLFGSREREREGRREKGQLILVLNLLHSVSLSVFNSLPERGHLSRGLFSFSTSLSTTGGKGGDGWIAAPFQKKLGHFINNQPILGVTPVYSSLSDLFGVFCNPAGSRPGTGIGDTSPFLLRRPLFFV